MDPMVGMVMDFGIVHAPWDMNSDMDMAMVMDTDTMVNLFVTYSQELIYNYPSKPYGPNIFLDFALNIG